MASEKAKGKEKADQDGALNEKDMKKIIGSLKGSPQSGAFGEIYLVKKQGLAVKKQAASEEFINESKILTTLPTHPNIIKMRGSLKWKDKGYLFLEWCPKSLLDEIYSRQLKLDNIIQIAIGTAKGIKCMHDSSIAHCDLKPANILLTEDKEAKLIDFGGAKYFNQKVTILTKAYAPYAPEGEQIIATPEQDIYAFGTILIQLLRCSSELQVKRNTKEITIQELVEGLEDDEVADQSLVKENNKKEVECLGRLVKDCVHKDPDRRPRIQQVLEVLLTLNS